MKPFFSAVMSTLTISPSTITVSSDGMPWTTTSLTEMQALAGKPS